MKLPAIISDEKPSATMVSILETPTSPIYGTDANPSGFEMQETLWAPPVEVPGATKAEAVKLLAHVEEASHPAPQAVVKRWLSSLGTLQANAGNETDAGIKVASYSAMLDYPAGCFTKSTLDAAARKFSPWFPDYGGLAEFLDEYAVPIRNMVERLRQIANAPEALARPEDPEVTKRHEEMRVRSEKLRHDSAQEILRRAYKSAKIEAPSGELTNAQFDADLTAHERGT